MVVALVHAAFAVALQDTAVIGFEEAIARAVAVSPAVAAASAGVQGPRGERAEALWSFAGNPVLSWGRTRRSSPLEKTHDREWSLSQEVEVGGSWLARASAADRRIRAAEAGAEDTRRLVEWEARRSYLRLGLAERRAALMDSAALDAERLGTFARAQIAVGEISRLENNTAVLEAARARSAAERAHADALVSAADLARLLALGADTIPHTAGLPPLLRPLPMVEERLVGTAMARRPDVVSVRSHADAASFDLSAVRRGLVPVLDLSLFAGREAETDDLLGLSVGFSFPLFNRRQAPLANARAAVAITRAVVVDVERRIRAEVRQSLARYVRAASAEQRFAAEVLEAAAANVQLAERALAAGELSVTDVIVMRATAVGAQLEYIEVLADAYEAWFDLAAALAASPLDIERMLTGEGER